MPTSGTVDVAQWDKPATYDQEVTTPYYYSTRFDDLSIKTEFSPAERSGHFRFTFPEKNAVVWLANRFPGGLEAEKTIR